MDGLELGTLKRKVIVSFIFNIQKENNLFTTNNHSISLITPNKVA